MKNKSSPVVHDIYKIILTHYPTQVWEILKTKFKSNMFDPSKEVLIESWDENLLLHRDDCYYFTRKNFSGDLFNSRKIYIDVAWHLTYKRNNRVAEGVYVIFNEIKTGNFNLIEIYEKYKNYTYNHKTSVVGDEYTRSPHFTTIRMFGMSQQFWIWGWEEKCQNQNLEALNLHLKRPIIRLCNLEWLDPLIDVVIDEVS